MLFAQLRQLPSIPETATSGSHATVQTLSPLSSSRHCASAPDRQPPVADGDDSTPEGVIRVLHASAGFSVSVLADLKELMSLEDGIVLPKRSLPLVSTLKRHEMEPEEQRFTNAKLILGASNADPEQMAEALQGGAEINTESDGGLTPLQICTKSSSTGLDIDLLLLYKETDLQRRNADGLTILHRAAKEGNITFFRRLFTSAGDRYVLDANGKTPLHTAATGGQPGLAVLKSLNADFEDAAIDDQKYLDTSGRSPLHEAAQSGHLEHCIELIKLGCDPAFLSVPPDGPYHKLGPKIEQLSPLYLAVREGHSRLVKHFFDMCAARSDTDGLLKFVNAKHHSTQRLLDCVKDAKLLQEGHLIADLLVSNGADWRAAWKNGDLALSFACSTDSPRLLLRLLCVGCRPYKKRHNIHRFADSILAGEDRELLLVAESMLSELYPNHKAEKLFYATIRTNGVSEEVTLLELLRRALESNAEGPLLVARFHSWKVKMCRKGSIGPNSTHGEVFRYYQALMRIATNLPCLLGTPSAQPPAYPRHPSQPRLYRYA